MIAKVIKVLLSAAVFTLAGLVLILVFAQQLNSLSSEMITAVFGVYAGLSFASHNVVFKVKSADVSWLEHTAVSVISLVVGFAIVLIMASVTVPSLMPLLAPVYLAIVLSAPIFEIILYHLFNRYLAKS